MGFGEAISNVTLEPKPYDWIAERMPQRAKVWIESKDGPTERRLRTWRVIDLDFESERDLAKPS